jgi:hypothetical protein
MAMFDYQTLLLDPQYAAFGVPATIGMSDGVTFFEGFTVIDKTGGVQLGDKESKVDSLEPACCIRHVELTAKGIAPGDLDGGTIEFNGSRWTIVAYPKRPVPSGARQGEVMLILSREIVTDAESDSSS